jgi:AraC-like DNA-binding protein
MASVRVVWPFRRASEELGLSRSASLELLGEGAAIIDDPDGRIPWSVLQQLLRYAVEQTQRPDIGVLAAAHFEPGLFELVEFAARSQPTMGGGITSLCRLIPLVIDCAELEMVARAETAVLEFKPPDSCPCEPASTEFALACIQIGSRRFTGHPGLVPREARFRHPRPADTASLEAVFGTRLTFEADTDCLVLPIEQLNLPHLQADSTLGAILQRIGDDVVAAQPRATTWRGAVRNQIAEQLARGPCSAESVAEAIGLTSRTMLRRLREEGSTFRSEFESMRHKQALAYLRDTELSATELAYLLDFRTAASFHRAFKRWTGTTPGEYRTRARRWPSNHRAPHERS